MAVLDLAAGVDAPDEPLPAVVQPDEAHERIGELGLGVAVLGQYRLDGEQVGHLSSVRPGPLHRSRSTVSLLDVGTLSALVRASHPAPTVVVTALAVLLAVEAGLDGVRTVLVCGAVLAGLLVYGCACALLADPRDCSVGLRGKTCT